MPLYEFRCEGCGEEFEELVSSSEVGEVTCPSCGAEEVRRLQSGFAIAGSGTGRSAGAGCSPGGSFG